MTLYDYNAGDMLKGTLMQNKPSDLFLHYLEFHPDLIGAVFREGLRYQYTSNELLEAMNEHRIEPHTVTDEIISRLDNMPSKEFH